MAAATVSKRQQARNERELHELLQVPGNGVCADCSAPNPAWASWNLGVFLCMRCASLHRKLGTHISKVKSLTMDTWNTDQVEIMKRTGNAAANRIFNPKNKRPDIPLDVDQVDSAMERFIRKKYQEKSLADGKPEPPTRSKASTSPAVPPKSPEGSPPPPVPSKKGRFFGFGFRASSSTYPQSKHGKKKQSAEPRVDSAWTIDSEGPGRGHVMNESELQMKLLQLADMGFSETPRNTAMLKRHNGDVERTVAALVQLGGPAPRGPSPGQRLSSKQVASAPAPGITFTNSANTANTATASSPSASASNNPFDQLSKGQTVGLSVAPPPPPPPPPPQQAQATGASYGSNNPFDQPSSNQNISGLSQTLAGMQISSSASRPLFPHSTGGYPMQQPQSHNPIFQTMTPPVPSLSHQQQQHGYFASPETNPFFQPAAQSQLQPQPTGNNPFFAQVQQQQQPVAQHNSTMTSTNPFFQTFSPSPQAPAHVPQSQAAGQLGYLSHPGTAALNPTNPFEQQSYTSNVVYAQPFQQSQYPQQQQQQQQPFSQFPGSAGSFKQYAQPSTMVPQRTGSYDKQSILALYNQPQLATGRSQALSSIPEPAGATEQGLENFQPKRSATMPITMSQMHSAGLSGAAGIRNPFLQNSASTTPQSQLGGPAPGVGIRHASQESVSINNLESGRHSPDAFANLSARHV